MFKVVLSLVLMATCFWGSWAEAQTKPKLCLEQALETAMANNLRIKAAKARLGINQADVITAGTRTNPSLMSDNGVAEYTYRLGVIKTFATGGKRHKRIALAQASEQAAMAQTQSTILDIRADVRRTYTQLYIAQREYEILSQIFEVESAILQELKQKDSAQFQAWEMLQAELTVLDLQADLLELKNTLVQTRNQLSQLLNHPLEETVTLESPGYGLPDRGAYLFQPQEAVVDRLPEIQEQALLQNPDIQQQIRLLEAGEKEIQLMKANRIPDFTLAVGPDWVVSSPRQLNVFAILTVDLPVLDLQKGPILAANARQHAVQFEKSAMELEVRLAVQNAHSALAIHKEQIALYESSLIPKALLLVSESLNAYRKDSKANILVPLDAEQKLREIQENYFTVLMRYQDAWTDLERLVGL